MRKHTLLASNLGHLPHIEMHNCSLAVTSRLLHIPFPPYMTTTLAQYDFSTLSQRIAVRQQSNNRVMAILSCVQEYRLSLVSLD